MVTATDRTGRAPGSAPDDSAAFCDWVRPHLGAMANLVARLAPMADRDDVVQDALTRAWIKRHHYDPSRGSPSAWLLAIAADQAAKARRRVGGRALLRPAEQQQSMDIAPRVDLERAIARLSRRQRLAIECVYFVGLSISDTAAVMGCAEGTVKSTLADARARLRSLLETTDER